MNITVNFCTQKSGQNKNKQKHRHINLFSFIFKDHIGTQIYSLHIHYKSCISLLLRKKIRFNEKKTHKKCKREATHYYKTPQHQPLCQSSSRKEKRSYSRLKFSNQNHQHKYLFHLFFQINTIPFLSVSIPIPPEKYFIR